MIDYYIWEKKKGQVACEQVGAYSMIKWSKHELVI